MQIALPCTSCCGALEMALRNAGIGYGDEVITPAATWPAPNLAAVHVGAKVLFADVSSKNYCIDPESIKTLITKKTKAIILVHIGGYCCEMDKIMDIARKKNLVVIEDCAQAHFSVYKNKYVGTWGNFGCFSFDIAKLMTAGEGGLLLCNEKDLGKWLFGTCGQSGSQIKKISKHRNMEGWNYRMTEFQAAILIAQLKKAKKQKKIRQINAKYLEESLNKINGLEVIPSEPDQNYYSFMFKYNKEYFKGVPKQKFEQALVAEGLTKMFCSPGNQEPVYRSPYFYDNNKQRKNIYCPVAEKAYEEEALGISGVDVLLGNKENLQNITDIFNKVNDNIDELVS